MDIVDAYTKDKQDFKIKAQEKVARSVDEIFSEGSTENCFTFDRNSIEEDEEIHQSILDNMKSIADNLPENFSFWFDRRGVN
jgi:hypothetical protein